MMMMAMQRMPFKRITAKTALTLISFSQNLVQGMWQDDSEFLQLPHIDYDKVQAFKKKTGGKQISLDQYCRKTKEERKELGLYADVKEFEDSEKAIESFPIIDVQVDYSVDGEKEVAVGDILTIKLMITHHNLGEKQSLGFVHSNKFPFLKQSSWYLIFTDGEEQELMGMDKLVIKEKVHIKEIKERMSKEGTINLTLLLRNDSYRGFDKRIDLKIPVLKEVKRAIPEYDDEDIQAQKAPSLMQSMMEMQGENDSDEEESEDETTASTSTQQTAGAPVAGAETKKEK
jgi:Sec63 Brl domain